MLWSNFSDSAASKQMNEMTQTFKGKTQKFVSDIMSDIKQSQHKTNTDKPTMKAPANEPQTYRDESRVSEFGKLHLLVKPSNNVKNSNNFQVYARSFPASINFLTQSLQLA